MPPAKSAAGAVDPRSPLRTPSGTFRHWLALAAVVGETPEWALWAIAGLLAFMMLLPRLKR